jgi:hypothetical protein
LAPVEDLRRALLAQRTARHLSLVDAVREGNASAAERVEDPAELPDPEAHPRSYRDPLDLAFWADVLRPLDGIPGSSASLSRRPT